MNYLIIWICRFYGVRYVGNDILLRREYSGASLHTLTETLCSRVSTWWNQNGGTTSISPGPTSATLELTLGEDGSRCVCVFVVLCVCVCVSMVCVTYIENSGKCDGFGSSISTWLCP